MSHTSAEKFECGSTFFRLTSRDGVRCSLARVANKRGNLANVYNTVTLSLFDQPHFVNQKKTKLLTEHSGSLSLDFSKSCLLVFVVRFVT